MSVTLSQIRYLIGSESPTSDPVEIVLAHDSVFDPVVRKGECVGFPQTEPLAGNHDGEDEGQTGQDVARDRETGTRVGFQDRIDHSSRGADENENGEEEVYLAVDTLKRRQNQFRSSEVSVDKVFEQP